MGILMHISKYPVAHKGNEAHESWENTQLIHIHCRSTPGALLLHICLLGVRAAGFPTLSITSGPNKSPGNKTNEPAHWTRPKIRHC